MRQYYSESTRVDLNRDASRRRGLIQKTLGQIRDLEAVYSELKKLIESNRDHSQLFNLTTELLQLSLEIAKLRGKVQKLEREQAQVQKRRCAMDTILGLLNGDQ